MCVCVCVLKSASWGAIPSACFVRCTCALKYNNNNNIASQLRFSSVGKNIVLIHLLPIHNA